MSNELFLGPPLKDKSRIRQKKFAPKVRTGCIVCRIRRVKCDETRPSCTKCTSTGRKCGGYTHNEGPRDKTLVTIRPAETVSPVSVSAGSEDLHMFHMFRLDVIYQTSGLFDKPFWQVDILRAARERPAIWHANLAFAAIYRWRELRHSDQVNAEQKIYDLYAFSIKHYNAAIQGLLSITKKTNQTVSDKETLLLTETLFVGLNAVQGNLTSAIAHANNANTFFYTWEFWKYAEAIPHGLVLRPSSLVALLTNFESQMLHRLRNKSAPRCRRGQKLFKVSTQPFRTIEDAYHEFVRLFAAIITSCRCSDHTESHVMLPEPLVFPYHVSQMLLWADKFDALRLAKSLAREIHGFPYKLLELQSMALRACGRCDPNDGVFMFDNQTAILWKILIGLEKLVGDALEAHDGIVPRFSFSISICELMYWITTACRDHDMRVRSVALLRKWPIQDGLLDSRLIAPLLETFTKVEDAPGIRNMTLCAEDGECECMYRKFICGKHRIVRSVVEFMKEGEVNFSWETVEDISQGRGEQVQKLFY
ncbi:hypothetical protein VHEMI10139 [[Torrubiella] hemipterigena]|uniref:Zn(2)-C6 fungal-type domain-containing protein n=1 Tax=[Torrubiella] hemipterigena TaxID=1531966 RepID=A0A0A1TRC7_9HYPO|nr:hypothetical protein VHEMI10139 [[Torrubiella] hemipterigena]